ncbi:hypothetical protein ACS0TY_010395 [Phlomoides rotata]
MLEELRLDSDHINETYKQMSKKYYNSKVKVRKFQEGGLVPKKVHSPHKEVFGPNWEGPFRISKGLSNGAY